MEMQNNISNASFLRWMKPILVALKELGGQGKPQEVRSVIAKNEHLTGEELSETRGKNNVASLDEDHQTPPHCPSDDGRLRLGRRGACAGGNLPRVR